MSVAIRWTIKVSKETDLSLRTFLGDSARALLLRAFVPVVILAALINGWVNTTLLRHVRANPAVIAALCAVTFAVLITWIISRVSRGVGGRIDRAEEARNLAQSELLTLNAKLENRVQERTRELCEKNQQMEEELQMAHELQTALLPQHFPTVPAHVAVHESALRFLSLYFPTGDVSGDFFSVFPVGEQAVGVFMCDVMGHGVRSALITSMIRALVEEHAQATTDPGELLTRVNRALAIILKQAKTTMFATCFYVVADVEAAELRFANAGHPSALHIRRGSASAEKLHDYGCTGLAMGLLPATTYTTSTRSMAEGDLVMLFTDGLFEVEAPSGELFTQEQLQNTVNRHATLPPEEFFNSVIGEIRQFSKRDSFDDDVCVVGMHIQRTK
jgi:serine phosphatase RsbU (regulator of sigma subunit)